MSRELKNSLRYKAGEMLRMARTGGLAKTMSVPPTLTLSAGGAVTTLAAPVQTILNTASPVFAAGAIKAALAIQNVSYSPWAVATQDLYYAGAVEVGGGVRLGGTLGIVFATDAPQIEILLFGAASPGNAYRVWINDELVALAPRADLPGDSSFRRLKIASGAGPLGKIMIEMDKYVRFGGVTLSASYSIWTVKTDSPRLMLIGDSFTDGTGADVFLTSFARQVGERLGTADTWVNGEGLLGYTTMGSLSGKTAREKLAGDVLAYQPDWVVVAFGINDVNKNAATVQTQATAYLGELLAGLPHAGVTVIGPWRAPDLNPAATIFAAVKAAAEAQPEHGRRLHYVDTLAENWQFGTGRVGAVAGVGNSNMYIGSDSRHPVQAGHDYLGARVAAAVTAHLVSVIEA